MTKPLQVGDSARLTRRFSELDVRNFADLSEDRNPLHLDEAYARTTVFGRRIVHGVLVSSMFSALLATTLPGRGTIYLKQSLSFQKPVYLDEEIIASVEVISIREDKPIVTLRTLCKNDKGEIVIDGEAVVKVPAEQVRPIANK